MNNPVATNPPVPRLAKNHIDRTHVASMKTTHYLQPRAPTSTVTPPHRADYQPSDHDGRRMVFQEGIEVPLVSVLVSWFCISVRR
jgi:hypothetical protein